MKPTKSLSSSSFVSTNRVPEKSNPLNVTLPNINTGSEFSVWTISLPYQKNESVS